MSSNASPRSLGDQLRLHRQLGLTASLSLNSCSKRQGCVRLSPLKSLEAIHPNHKLSLEDCEEELPCPHAYGERLGRSLRFRSLGLTASQVIAQSKIGRDVGRCHGEQEGRIDVGFFVNFIVGKDNSMVKFPFWGVLALSGTWCEYCLTWCRKIGSPTSLKLQLLHASSGAREPISLHQAVLDMVSNLKNSESGTLAKPVIQPCVVVMLDRLCHPLFGHVLLGDVTPFHGMDERAVDIPELM